MDILKQLLKQSFPDDKSWSDSKLIVDKYDGAYTIEYGQMYERPDMSVFDVLTSLSNMFGTTKIDIDDYSNHGCETCDYGSDYGHTITLKEVTKNKELLDQLVGRGDLNKETNDN